MHSLALRPMRRSIALAALADRVVQAPLSAVRLAAFYGAAALLVMAFVAGATLSGNYLAVTHPTTVRNTVANTVVDLLDAGSGAGTLVFKTAGAAEVATLTFSDPAFGNAASGTATANAITSDTNATGGATTNFTAQDSDTNAVFSGAVGTSGSDINLSSTVIGASDTVSVSSLTYTAPA